MVYRLRNKIKGEKDDIRISVLKDRLGCEWFSFFESGKFHRPLFLIYRDELNDLLREKGFEIKEIKETKEIKGEK